MSGTAAGLSEEDVRKLLASLDPHTVDQLMQQVVQPAEAELGSPGLGVSSGANLGVGPDPARSRRASLSRVSLTTPEPQRAGLFSKKKSSVPSLVLTFRGAPGAGAGAVEEPGDEGSQAGTCSLADSAPPYYRPATPRMLGTSALDRLETGSVVSHRSHASHASHTNTSSGAPAIEQEKQEKIQRFLDFFTMVLSIAYGLMIMILSIGFYSYDLLLNQAYKYNATEIWNLILSSVGILLLFWLIFDIQRYIRDINRMGKGRNFIENFKLVEGEDGEFHIEVPMDGKKQSVPEYYGFSVGRHAGSFFLKIGASVFCFGHLIHMGFNIVKHVYSMENANEEVVRFCGQKEGLAYDIIYPIFSFVQLYFLFKYGNVIVNKNKWLARFAFAHCMSSSLSFWINTVISETLDAIVKKYFVQHLNTCKEEDYNTTFSTTAHPDVFANLPKCNYNGNGNDLTNNVICVIETRALCNTYPEAEVFRYPSLGVPYFQTKYPPPQPLQDCQAVHCQS